MSTGLYTYLHGRNKTFDLWLATLKQPGQCPFTKVRMLTVIILRHTFVVDRRTD